GDEMLDVGDLTPQFPVAELTGVRTERQVFDPVIDLMSDGTVLRDGRGVFGQGFETTSPERLFLHPGELGDRFDRLSVARGVAEDAAEIFLERFSRDHHER